MDALYVAIAGFIGAILRVWLGNTFLNLYPDLLFPYPTLCINMIGSFLLAYFLVFVDKKIFQLQSSLILAISTGLLGSFTTFSTFSVETLYLFHIQAYKLALLYILISFIGGFFFAWLGIKAGNRLPTKKMAIKLRRNES